MAIEKAEADTFPKLLLHHSRQRGERPAIREKSRGIWRTVTWRELADEAAALAAALSARGLQRGAHVAFVGDNRPRLYAAMCAAHWLGAIAVPLYQDATADEMASSGSERGSHPRLRREPGAGRQAARDPAALPNGSHASSTTRTAACATTNSPSLSATTRSCSRAGSSPPQRADFLQAEAARGSGQDSAFLFFTSGTTGPAKGVVLTHGALIDRARVAATTESLKDTDVAMAYLPPGWIGQNLFSYVQPMVVGYCVCCPESSETMLADMREMGPTYFLATPRVLEALLTQVSMRMEDTGGFNQRLYRRRHGRGPAHRAQRRTASAERPPHRGRVQPPDFRSAARRARDEQGARGLHRRRRCRSRSADFFRALGINLKQLYGSTETGFFVAMQRDGAGQAGHGRTGGRWRRTEIHAAARNPGALTRAVQGVSPRPRNRRRRQGMPKAGSTPATPAISAMTGICGSSTA